MVDIGREPAERRTVTLRRRQLIVAVALLLLVSLLVAWQWRLAVAWWGHELLATTQVGPLSIRDWARIGKVVQLLAGLTVILDVIGPEPIRAAGEALTKHRRSVLAAVDDLRPSHRVAAQSARMFGSLMFMRGTGEGGPVWWYEVVNGGPPVAVLPSLGQESLNEWHGAAMARLDGPHACDTDHSSSAVACHWQIAVTQEEIDRHLRENVPGLASNDLAGLRDRVSAAYGRMAAGVFVAGAVVAVALAIVVASAFSTSSAGLLSFGFFTVVVMLTIVLGFTFALHPPTSRWAPYRCGAISGC